MLTTLTPALSFASKTMSNCSQRIGILLEDGKSLYVGGSRRRQNKRRFFEFPRKSSKSNKFQ
jgi:hypothetical protein